MSQAKVIEIPLAHLQAVLRGEARMLNFPPDGELVAQVGDGKRLLMRVHSKSFEPVGHGEQLNIVPAVIARHERRPTLRLPKSKVRV